MTDYSEEQRNELEALESIYPDSFTVLSEKPATFTITVTSEAGENDETVQTTLKFTYREKYPDETPLYEIVSQENLDDNDVTDIIKLLEQQVRKMEYLNSTWYNSHFSQNFSLKSNAHLHSQLCKLCLQPYFLFFQQRFHGTPVTIENFLNWKAKFDAELLEMKRKKMKEDEQAGKNKLSG
ncbi:RWDD1 protein, partial [Todus mexicanus]|nr:RWDD1 protein [Todus mexicanus]